METSKTIEVAGHRWTVLRLGCMAQIEIETIFIRLLGQPLGFAIGALVENVAPPLIAILRETAAGNAGKVRKPGSWDLANLLDVDTADPRIAAGWNTLLDAIGSAAGDTARGFAASLHRLDHKDLHRLMQIVIFEGRHVFVEWQGQTMAVDRPDILDRVTKCDPGAKWALLLAALSVTYQSRDDRAEEAAADVGDGASG